MINRSRFAAFCEPEVEHNVGQIMNTKIITGLVLLLFSSMGYSDKKSTVRTDYEEPAQLQTTEIKTPSKSSGMRITEEILKHTILPSYSVEDTELGNAVEILNQESKKYASQLDHKPLHFVVQDAVSKQRVTLTTKNSSMQIICEVLAAQSGGYIELDDFEVLFTMGDWDTIGVDDDAANIEQEALPALPDSEPDR